jgi:hypothetical protein
MANVTLPFMECNISGVSVDLIYDDATLAITGISVRNPSSKNIRVIASRVGTGVSREFILPPGNIDRAVPAGFVLLLDTENYVLARVSPNGQRLRWNDISIAVSWPHTEGK